MSRYPKREVDDPFRGWDDDPDTELPCDREQVMANSTDGNRRCPRYVALAGTEGDYLESSDQLPELLTELRDTPADVAIWKDNGTLAAIVFKGAVQVFEEAPPPRNGTNGYAKNGTARKHKVFGHAVCAVLVWMGVFADQEVQRRADQEVQRS
jgi:hypothetical protein